MSDYIKYVLFGIVGILIIYYYIQSRKNPAKPKVQLIKSISEPHNSPKVLWKKYWYYILAVIIIISSVIIYQRNKSSEKIELPLSEAIILSKDNVFDNLKIETSSLVENTLILEVVKDKEVTIKDIEDKELTLKDQQKVYVNVGALTIKDIQDMGFVLPENYRQITPSDNIFLSILSSLMTPIILIALLYIFMSGSLFSSVGNKFKPSATHTKFSDIGGITEVKDSLKEVVAFLKDPTVYKNIGARIPKGILLEGLPGTGKTMLAQAIANEAGVPFYYATGSEFHGMFVGLAANRVKKLFKTAKKQTSVIFIDEFESIGHERMKGSSDVSREWNHTLTQLLSEMDGFDENTRVVVFAATNRADVLDPAVVRAGRFDRKIYVPLPNLQDRIDILKIHARGKRFEKGINFEQIAKQTVGFSGADLALLLNESAILAVKQRANCITLEYINQAIDKVVVGEEHKNKNITEKEKRMLAYHEAGHALVASLIPEGDKVQRVSILAHGQAGGFTRIYNEEERLTMSKAKLNATISILLAGRCAEELVIGDISSGAQNDLQKVNQLVRQMVENFGMGKIFGLRYVGQSSYGLKEVSLESQKIVDEDIQIILNECYKNTQKILIENRAKLDRLSARLLEVESINGDEVEKLLS